MITIIILGLIIISPIILALELVISKIIIPATPPVLLDQEIINGKIIDKTTEKKTNPANLVWLSINPGLWVMKKAMAGESTFYKIKVSVNTQEINFSVSSEDFSQFKKGQKIRFYKNHYTELYKVSWLEMLFSGEFKRHVVNEYSQFSLK